MRYWGGGPWRERSTRPRPTVTEDAGTVDLTVERRDDVLSVEVTGRIDGSGAAALEEAMRNATAETDRAAIADFRELAHIGSAGLRAILVAAKSAKARGAGPALCGLSEQILEVFRISGFDRIVPIHDAPDDARAAIGV